MACKFKLQTDLVHQRGRISHHRRPGAPSARQVYLLCIINNDPDVLLSVYNNYLYLGK